jgi:hypothetical protein
MWIVAQTKKYKITTLFHVPAKFPGREEHLQWKSFVIAYSSGRKVRNVGLRPLACCDCCFEFAGNMEV